MKKFLALVLVLCMVMTIASFPATAATTNPKRVKIFTMGDSFTAGICEPNAYRYYIYENLIQDGGVFEFIGPSTSGDWRVTSLYNKHGGVGGAIIGCANDYKWNGSGWSTNAWTYTNPSTGVTIKSNGSKNSIHYRLFAGSDGSNNYTKTEYGNYVADADIVVLYIGLNDYYSTGATGISADIEHVKNRYYTVVDRIYEINPDVSLYVCSLNVIEWLRGYNLNPGDAGYDTSVFKYNEFVLNDVVAKYNSQGKKITGVSLNQPGYEMIVGVDNPSDDAHPNEKGNRKIGTQIYNAIKGEVLELNEQTGAAYNPTRVSSLTIDKTSATLKTGENLTITSTIAPSTAEVITTVFSSSNESVATVDGYGRITAVAPGTATIYATALDSMRPGATKIEKTCTVTVTNESYTKIGDNFLPVFMEDFAAASSWTGNVENIKGKAYKHNENTSSSSITTKRSFDLKEGFSISFKAALMGGAISEVNSTNRSSQHVSVKVGNYELRIAVCGKVVSFYNNGTLVDERVFSVPVVRQNDDLYTLTKYQDKVYVYRNNELLFTSDVNKYDVAEGNVTISVAGTGSKNIRNLQVKSVYGLQQLSPTATNNGKDASAAVDSSTSTRYSIESGKSATAADWTSANNSVILDLGAVLSVSDLNIYWGAYSGGAWGKTMPDAYNVSYSEDGVTYTPAKSYSGIHAYIMGEAADTISTNTTSFSAGCPSWATETDRTTYSYGVIKEADLGWQNVQYIKIEMTKVSYNPTIAEIEVFTTAYAPGEAPDGVMTTYTVNYVDQQGNTLAPSKTGEGYIDGNVSEKAIEIEGYTPLVKSKSIILVDGENVIDFVYELIPEKLPLTGDNVIAVKDWGWTNDGKLPDCTKDALFDGESAADKKGYFTFTYNPKAFASNANYIEIDLGSTLDISHIVIQGGSPDWNYAHLLAYDVYVAGPDKEYGEIPAGKQDFGTEVTSANKVRTDTTNIKMNDVRYIKIVGVYGARRPVIGEIEVYRSLEENAERKETTYTVNYVDTEGNPVATAKSGAGYVGDEVTEKAVAVTGYIIDNDSQTITLVDGTNEINFIYTKRITANYTVNYVDADGKPVATAKNGTGYVDDKVTEDAPAVSGYTVDQVSQTITLIDGTNTITFTYTKVAAGDPVSTKLTFVGGKTTGVESTSKYPVSNAVDGDKTTFYVSDQYKNSQGNLTIDLIFELDTPGTLDSLDIQWGNHSWGRMGVNKYNVAVSSDNVTYTTIREYDGLYDKPTTYKDTYGDDITYSGTAGGGSFKAIVEANDIDVDNVRYIKIEIRNTLYRPAIAEIEATVIPTVEEEEKPVESLGGQVRLPSAKLSAGLRFAATIDKKVFGDVLTNGYNYNELEAAGIKVGMLLLPTNLLGENATLADYIANDGALALDIPAVRVFEEDENTVTYTAVVTNIPEKDYTRDVIAVPYICINGEYTFYEEMTRNYKQVTEAVAEAYEKGEVELTEEQIALVEKVIGRTLTVA